MRIKLIIFDNDGVLVDSEPIANRVLHELLVENGAIITYEEALHVFKGDTLTNSLRIIQERYGVSQPERFLNTYYQRTRAAFERELKPIENAEILLRNLRIPYCVASNSAKAKLQGSLHLAGLLPLLEGRLFSAEEVASGKPAPDLFLHAAAVCGVQPANCLVVEDSPQGVLAAQAAGMQVIGYVAPTLPDTLSAMGIPVISNLLHLLPIVAPYNF